MTVFPFKLLTPEKRVYDGKAVSVTVSAADGRLAVLAGHAPMLALLIEGPIVIRTETETIEGVAGPGILQVDRAEAVVMVHALAWADDVQDDPPAEDGAAKDMLL